MDVDLEMVDTSRVARGGVVPAEDLENDWIGRPQVRRQNNCFWVLLVSFTLAMAVFVVGTVYLGPGESPVTENEFSPESGIVGNDSKEKLQTGFVSIASSNKHHENTALEKWMKEHGVGGGEVTTGVNATQVNINHGVHGHSKVTTPGVKSHAVTHSQTSASSGTTQAPNTAGDTSQNSGDNAPASSSGDNAPPSGSGDNAPPNGSGDNAAPPSTSPDVVAWLATTVTKGDGIMYEVVGQLFHDNQAFIEGLTYVNGLLYESTGLNGHSSVRTLDPETGHGVQLFPMSNKYFGEGLAYANDKFYQLTYKSQTGFIYDAADLSKDPEKFNYSSTTNEGYGLTFDAEKQELIESDGSEYLHFWDPQTFQELRKVKVVRQDGTAALRMNELEWWRGRVLANVWFEDVILVIDPVTGVVEKEYDFSTLWPQIERRKTGGGVLNGISISKDDDVLYITGKNWDRMFKIRLLSTSAKVAAWLATPVELGDGIKYEIVDQLVHDNTAFTEGLAYVNGLLYESNGLNGQSNIRTLDPVTGEVVQSFPIDAKYFGEGLTFANGKLIQLTYKSKTGFIYDATDLTKEPETFTYSSTTNEGWGLTFDAGKQELIESDGSEYLHFWDPQTFHELRKVKVVQQDGAAVKRINELEWWRGRVLANVWYQDVILVINPATGVVEKEYDFSTLWPLNERRKKGADVLNGISMSEDPDVLYITGKNWDRMFKIRLLV